MIITGKDILLKHVRVDSNVRIDFVQSLESQATDKYFGLFSPALIAQISGYINDADPDKSYGYACFERAVVKLTIFEYMQTGEVSIGSNGLYLIDNDQVKTPFLGQVKRHLSALFEEGFVAIEALINLMTAQEAKFSEWPTSPGYAAAQNTWIGSASEFNDLIRLKHKHNTFYSLLPVISDVVDLDIVPEFSNDLLEAIRVPEEEHAAAAKSALQKAIANFTLAAAIRGNLIRFSGDGVVAVANDATTAANNLEAVPDPVLISAQISRYVAVANRFLSIVKKIISDNPSAFPIEVEDDYEQQAEWT